MCIGSIRSRRFLWWSRKKYAMTLKEMNRLKSNCSATSSINALLIVYYLPLSFAMAIRHGYAWALTSMHETYPYPCIKPLKHESMPETPCDIRYTKLTNPQSYCGDRCLRVLCCWEVSRRRSDTTFPDHCQKVQLLGIASHPNFFRCWHFWWGTSVLLVMTCSPSSQ